MTQPYGPPGQYPPQQPKKRGIPTWLFVLTVVAVPLAMFVGCGVGVGIGSAGNEPVAVAEPADAPNTEPAKKPDETKKAEPEEPATTVPGDGVFIVGEDIKPGTYKSAGGDGRPCFWARLKKDNTTIDNGISDGSSVATIRKSDFAFETSGCQKWTRR